MPSTEIIAPAGPRTPLIGRDAERSELDKMLENVSQGRGGLVLLGGEPGVGKTRLAAEILQDARERGLLALTGHAYEEEGVPFITAAEILEQMIRLVPAQNLRRMLGENASEMTRLLPELKRRFPDIPEPVESPPEQQRRYLFKNVLEFLQRSSRETPMVMLLDDLTKYSFTHELIRHTLLSSLSLPRRQRLHLRIAEAMEKVYAQRLEDHASDLAYHLYQAGASADFEKTIHYLMLAGDRSLAAAASDKAIYYFDTALTLLEGEESKQKAVLLFKRGKAYRAASLWEECERDWQEALPLYEAQGEVEFVARICSDLAYQAVWRNQTKKSKELATRGLTAVGQTVSKGHSLLLSSMAHAHSLENDYQSAQTLATQAVEMAEQLGDDHLLGQVLVSRIYVGEHHMQARSMVTDGERAVEIVRRLGSPWDLSNALGITLFGYLFLGDLERTEEACGEVESLAMGQGDVGVLLHVDAARYILQLSRGDLTGAERSAEHGIEICREQGFPWSFFFYSYRGLAQLLRGRWTEASASFANGVRTEVTGVYRGFSRAFEILGKAYEGSMDADFVLKQAKDILPEPGVISGAGSMSMLHAVVESFGILGKPEGAPGLYPMFQVLLDEENVFAFHPELVQKLAGIAAALDEHWDKAEQHLSFALKQADELPYRTEQPEVRRWYAWMLLHRDQPGDQEKAQAFLTEAVEMYNEMGMAKHVEIAEAMIRR